MTCGTFLKSHFKAMIYAVSRFLNSFELVLLKIVCVGCLGVILTLVGAVRAIILSRQEHVTSSKRISTILSKEFLNYEEKLLKCI